MQFLQRLIKTKKELFFPPFNELSIDLCIMTFALMQIYGEFTGIALFIKLKPIPIVIMIIKSVYLVDCHKNISRGLFFSLVGDLFLMAKTYTLFKIGTICFLIAHFFYISAFLSDLKSMTPISKRKRYFSYIMTFFVLMFLIANNYVLWEVLPDKILFPIYGIVLSSMASSSLYRYNEKNPQSYTLGIIGSILFMISDSLIAHTKLNGYEESLLAGTIIMTLYYVGQFLILKGMSRKRENKKNFQIEIF